MILNIIILTLATTYTYNPAILSPWEYGGKSNQGFCNDDFGIDVFTDKLNDSRYQKTFRLEYVTGINTSGASTPVSYTHLYCP